MISQSRARVMVQSFVVGIATTASVMAIIASIASAQQSASSVPQTTANQAPPPPLAGPAGSRKGIGVAAINAAEYINDDRYALIIGINDYADDKIQDLTTCQNDALGMRDTLIDPNIGGVKEENVTMLLGDEASFRNIRKSLSKLRNLPANSTVFIYFSGHGGKVADEGFWITQDAELDNLGATALSDRDLRVFLERIPSERVVVLLDCCYATATVEGQKSLDDFNDVLNRFTGKGRAFLMAAGSGEEAIEAEDLKHSVFTYYVLKGLDGAADENKDGVVVLTELATYIDSHVADEARVRGGVQRPVVRMESVSGPSRFRLAVNVEQLRENQRSVVRETEERNDQLAQLKELYLNEHLSLDVYQLGRRLLSVSTSELDQADKLRREEFLAVLANRMESEKLPRALAALARPTKHLKLNASPRMKKRDDGTSTGSTSATSVPNQVQLSDSNRRVRDLLKIANNNVNQEHGSKLALMAVKELQRLAPHLPEVKKLADHLSNPPKDATEYVNTIGQRFKLVKAGQFETTSFTTKRGWAALAGPAEPKMVQLANGFMMSHQEVSRGQFAHFIAETEYVTDAEREGWAYVWKDTYWARTPGASWKNPGFPQSNDHPVVCVSWNDAAAFCQWLSQTEGYIYRLPNEAEWEFACRSGSNLAFSNGADIRALKQVGWCSYDGRPGSAVAPQAVGKFAKNAWGLHDMHGNVSEWCSEATSPYMSNEAMEIKALGRVRDRVLRGGSWYDGPWGCQSDSRLVSQTTYRCNAAGFRVLIEVQ